MSRTKWIIFWSIIGALFIIFIPVIRTVFLEPDREGLFPENDIRLLYSANMRPSVELLIVTNTDPNKIIFHYNADFINFTQPSFIALILPYYGTFNEQNMSGSKSFDTDTVFVKEYNCSKEKPCSNLEQDFKFSLDKKIDQKQSFNHSVRFRFSDSAPTDSEYSYVLKFAQNDTQIKYGFRDLDRPQVMVILDKTADGVYPTPQEAVPSSFSDKNLQRIWPISSEITYQLDYHIPSERKAEGDSILTIAYVGVIMAMVSLVPFLLEKKRKNKDMPRLKSWLKPKKEDKDATS